MKVEKKTNATFMDMMRSAFHILNNPAGVSHTQLADIMGLSGDAKRPIYTAIQDMHRRGEIIRVSRTDSGRKSYLYYYVGRGRKDPVEKQKIMWRLMRSMRQTGQSVTPDDLIELADATRSQAENFLASLVRCGIARKIKQGSQPKFHLLKDSVTFPFDKDKKDESRQIIRAQLRQAAEKIENVKKALAAAQQAYEIIMDAFKAIDNLTEDKEAE